MTVTLDVVGLVVTDMAATLAFYRRLGLDIPAEADSAPHAEVALAGGLRLTFDTVEVIASFDPEFTLTPGGASLAFLAERPQGVDDTYREGCRVSRSSAAMGRVLRTAVRRGARPGRAHRGSFCRLTGLSRERAERARPDR